MRLTIIIITLFLLPHCKIEKETNLKLFSFETCYDTINNKVNITNRIINNSDHEVSYWEYTCSKTRNWLVDDTSIYIIDDICDKNFLVKRFIKSKDSVTYSFNIQLKRDENYSKKTIKIGFKFVDGGITADSAERIYQSLNKYRCMILSNNLSL